MAETEAVEEEEEAEATDLAVEAAEAGEEEVITDHWMIARRVMVVLACSIRGIGLRLVRIIYPGMGIGSTSYEYRNRDVGIGFQGMSTLYYSCMIMDGTRSLVGVERDIDIWRCYGVSLMVA